MAHYEIYAKHPTDRIALRSGFGWLAPVLGGLTPIVSGLVDVAALLTALEVALLAALYFLKMPLWMLAATHVAVGIYLGFQARRFREMSAERRDYAYLCTLPAHSPGNAVAKLDQVGGVPLPEWRARRGFTLPDVLPKSLRRIGALAWLTLVAAFRFRLVLVLGSILLLTVFALPSMIMHDGTARGFTQILLTYSLSAVMGILGLCTLWLACGTLANDIEECQIHLVMAKPIPRWEIWLGKWTGILILNSAILVVAGIVIHLLLVARAGQLRPEQQEVLRREVLVARSVAREPRVDITPDVERALEERLKDPNIRQMDRAFVRKQIEEQVKAQQQVVMPGHFRRWQVPLGSDARTRLKDIPLHLRVKFFTSDYNANEKTYAARWIIGPADAATRHQIDNSLSGETPSEFEIPPNLIGNDGTLTIDCQNWNDLPLLFPIEDGFEVLHREGGFAGNFARGLLILLFWLALLAAIGLACSSRMSFAVSSFVSISLLVVAFSGGTIRGVIEQGGIMDVDHDTGMARQQNFINTTAVKVFSALQKVIQVAEGYSPVDSLSTGRNIGWTTVGAAFLQIVGLMGGLFAATGMAVLTRREIALPT